jgi:anaerobic magnesium-protoporphyrin IX monomethyl ester cyclase
MIKMKIALIDPPGDVSGFNAGLGYLSAALKAAGHEVRVVDFNNDSSHSRSRMNALLAWEPGIAGFSLKTNTNKAAMELAALFDKGKTKIVAGGPGVTCEKDAFLRDYPVYDACFTGEAEETFAAHLADVVAGKRADYGLHYLAAELDKLPFPDYSGFDTVSRIKRKYPLVTSRGCPYDCVYCSVNKISGRQWRKRSPENVIEELKQARGKYGIERFDVADDNFTMDLGRAKEICRLMIGARLGLKWGCINGIRADRVDEELLVLMKNAGCDVVWFGIESMNEEVFDSIKKGEKLDAVKKAVGYAKKAGISACGFFIAGLPGSTYEKDMKSLEKARELGLDESLWSLSTPYPHTELWDWSEKNAKWLADFRQTSFFKRPKAVVETADYPAGLRIKMFYRGNLSGFSYSCFFPKKIGPGDLLNFMLCVLKYDFWNTFTHVGKIFFNKYHRKHLKEAFKRILRLK